MKTFCTQFADRQESARNALPPVPAAPHLHASKQSKGLQHDVGNQVLAVLIGARTGRTSLRRDRFWLEPRGMSACMQGR